MPDPIPHDAAGHLADTLVADGTIVSPAVEAAFRAVPRHVFVPEVAAEVAYEPYRAVVTKGDARGRPLSSMSAANIQATMLEQARIEPGMRVLEIGSGGYNAALLAQLVGAAGAVVTMDIDAEVVERARRFLPVAGAPQVRVVLGDGEDGCPHDAPFDRIVVTVRAWDIPPSWTAQLGSGGRLIVPLDLRGGLTRSFGFRSDETGLFATSAVMCGFVPMQGAGAHAAPVVRVPDRGLTVRLDGAAPDPAVLAAFMGTERTEVWTGLVLPLGGDFQDMHLWLAAMLDGFATLSLDGGREPGHGSISSATPFAVPASVTADALGYLGTRPSGEGIEFGGHAFGPGAAELAATIATTVREWHDRHSGGSRAVVTVHPAGSPIDPPTVGRIIPKRHSAVRIEWPAVAPP